MKRTDKFPSRGTALLQGSFLYISISLPLLWFVHLERGIAQAAFLLGLLAADFLLVLLLQKFRLSGIVCRVAAVIWSCIAALVCAFVIFRSSLGDYRCAPMEADHFADKTVLFLVPHQDDDVSLAGGVAEQYTRSGSQVSMVFVTNGDNGGLQEIRVREALAAAEKMGIPSENVYYLGFGDGWQGMESYSHIYNSPDSAALWTSYTGSQETQDTALKPCYLKLPYTRENVIKSIQSIILDLRPDVIYATDYDAHLDHRAVSLFFDEAMGGLLKESENYHPTVFKGFCYRTAWYAAFDFADSLNLLSTQEPPLRDTEVDIPQYAWEDRVRLPLLTTGLNRLLTKTDVYDLLRIYRSQGASSQTGAIANGDRVYWQRNTTSLLYGAEFLADGVPTALLNDFKLMDAADISTGIADSGIQPIQSALTLTSREPIRAKVLGLYDDPRPENQILAGYAELDDGTRLEFGPLNNNGTATYLPLPDGSFQSLTLHITAWEGTPGLTEVEAYPADVTAPTKNLDYFLFVDERDSVVYDYYIEDSATFSLYTYPHNAALDFSVFQITKTGSEACTYAFEDGSLTVFCPEGERCEITVTYGGCTNTMAFSNPGKAGTWLMETIQAIDYALLHSHAPGSINAQITYYTAFFEKMEMLLTSVLA